MSRFTKFQVFTVIATMIFWIAIMLLSGLHNQVDRPIMNLIQFVLFALTFGAGYAAYRLTNLFKS
jgi:hypothetical protein